LNECFDSEEYAATCKLKEYCKRGPILYCLISLSSGMKALP
jgi:hypothetical protein